MTRDFIDDISSWFSPRLDQIVTLNKGERGRKIRVSAQKHRALGKAKVGHRHFRNYNKTCHCSHKIPVLRIQTILIRIRILLFTLIRIQIRILLFIWYGSGSDCLIRIRFLTVLSKVMYPKQYFLYILNWISLSVGLPGPNQKAFFVTFSFPVDFVMLIRT